jgi:zinc D-Ala-D-Ala carboxypeptidase
MSTEHETKASFEGIVAAGLEELGRENSVLLYPVSWYRRLPDDYPQDSAAVELTTIEENKSVVTLIVQPLRSLLDDARSQGFTAILTSGFRSIQQQERIFSGYVEEERESGLNQEDAIAAANAYSAKAGYSEHHLGTTVDIRTSVETEEWDIARNGFDQGVYGWMRGNAHHYGFILSYPTGNESNDYAKPGSGYKSAEPWHLRFVGKNIAQYLYEQRYLNPNTPITLNTFLEKAYPIVESSKPG